MSSHARRTSRTRRSRSFSRDADEDDYNHRMNFPPNIEGMTSLKVDNITQRTGVNLLKKVFSKFGDLGDVYVPRYPDTFASRGFAFVRFARKRDAEEAMRKMNGYVLDGRTLSIQMARYARPSPSRQVSSGPRRGPPSYSRGGYGGNNRFMSRNGHSSFRGHRGSGFHGRPSYRRSPFRKRSISRSRSRSRSRDRKHRSSRRHRSRSRSRDRKDKDSKKRNEKDKRRSKSPDKDKDDKNDSMDYEDLPRKSRSRSRGSSKSDASEKVTKDEGHEDGYSEDRRSESRSKSRTPSRSKSRSRSPDDNGEKIKEESDN